MEEFWSPIAHWFASESNPGEYNWATTATQALGDKDLTDKVAVITGANTGIGKETARVLLNANANVIMACRSLERGEKARKDLIESVNSPNVEDRVKLLRLDIGDLASVKEFSRDFDALDMPCHYLIENAGVMAIQEFQETAQGIERQWGVNHLGHFLLGKEMLPHLEKSAPSRLIVLSSTGHNMAPALDEWIENHCVKKIDPPRPDEYEPWSAYGLAKMSNVLFAQEFNRRYSSSGITAVSVHPGAINTELSRNMPGWQVAILSVIAAPFCKSIPQGAATTVRCVALSDDEIVGGAYYADCNPHAIRQDAVVRTDIPAEETFQYRLWEMSEQLVANLGF